MVTSWPKFTSQCKSRLSAIARCCYLGRIYWRNKCEEIEDCHEELLGKFAKSEARREQLEQENVELRERLGELEAELAQPQPLKLPLGERPPGQQYSAGMIALCVNLASKIGLRPTVRALHVIFDWLDIEERIPQYQSIRIWMQRIGLDRMQSVKKTTGGIWLADHTNQIGREKVLMVMRVRGPRLSRRRLPLRHRDMEVLALVPGEVWKREDVAEVYQSTANRCGRPRAIESDGAVELREPAESLGKRGEKPLVIRDPKHYLANRFEALLKKDPQYPAFAKKLGRTRPAVQQTELAHFLPPAFKSKARFMNIEPTLNWASAVLWHLDHPESRSRKHVTKRRMREKLGWLRDFASSIQEWEMCQAVISTTLTFINKEGIFRGAAKQLEARVAHLVHTPMSLQMAQTAAQFLRQYERKLRPDERLAMSTEILESSFALYKQLEKQHSKGGFTSLLLTFPTLLRPTTAREVTASFARVKVADVKEWTTKHLPNTLASKRQLMFREARKAKGRNSATSLGVAV